MAGYVAVASASDLTDVYELPLENDGTVLLSAVKIQFRDAQVQVLLLNRYLKHGW